MPERSRRRGRHGAVPGESRTRRRQRAPQSPRSLGGLAASASIRLSRSSRPRCSAISVRRADPRGLDRDVIARALVLPRASDKTIAVLAFRNAGPPEDDYLADELTDNLIDALSMTRGLRVRARSTLLRFRAGAEGGQAPVDVREIGLELGVEAIVEGSVRRGPGAVRMTVRLVGVIDGFQLWAKRFDRSERDVLAINDEAARAIARALRGHGAGREARAAERPEGRRSLPARGATSTADSARPL